jgi:hypothetical protein
MNLYEQHYNPHTFHINAIQTVLVRLDGKMLRISRPDKVMLKHGFHTDPTLVENEPRMIAQNIYDLTNAQVNRAFWLAPEIINHFLGQTETTPSSKTSLV